MSYIRQLYLQKKKELENEVMRNRHTNGVQARFVANKVIDKYFKEFNKDDLGLTTNRLNRLVELVDLNYRKQNQWKPLCNDGYIISKNGLVFIRLLCHYEYLLKDHNAAKSYFERSEREYQIMSEAVIDKNLNKEIDALVDMVMYGTRYIDTVDLRDMLNSDEIQELKFNCVELEQDPIPEEIVAELFADFDFKRFECFNASEKERWCV